jgi:tripartite-type tricarboxylate transporter receptor subunit TctC
MKLFITKFFLTIVTAILSINLAHASVALVVPSSPGGGASALAMAFADELTKHINTNVVLEYKTGADGRVAANYLKSVNNVPMLLLSYTSTYVRNTDVIPGRDITPIAFLGKVPLMIVAKADFPYNSIDELLKNSPPDKKYFYGTTGNGSSMHLAMLDMQTTSKKFLFEHIPYRGSSAGMIDLLGGRIDLVVSGAQSIAGHVENGSAKVIGIFGNQPSSIVKSASKPIGYEKLPDAAAVATIYVNSSLDPITVKMLTNGINKTLNSFEFKQRVKAQDVQEYIPTKKTILDQVLTNIQVIDTVIKTHNIEVNQ